MRTARFGPEPTPAYDRIMARSRRVGGCLVCELDPSQERPMVGVGSSADGTAKKVLASRVVWERHNGPIPDGLWVLHRCVGQYRCVEPSHLYLGDAADNMRDCIEQGRNHELNRTHCPASHAYEGDNLYVDRSGKRRCLTCKRERNRSASRAWYARKKVAS